MKIYSQAGQDLWVIRDVFGEMENGFYVDIGAADGINLSNTYLLEKKYAWSGICIEADKNSFSQLAKSRKATCYNACLDSEVKEVKFTKNEGYYGGIIDAETDNALNDSDSVTLKTEILRNILEKSNAPKIIHYLSLDVEGAEERVLDGFPYSTHTFLAATIERPSEKLKNKLKSEGYILVGEIPGLDSFYVHESIQYKYAQRLMSLAELNRGKTIPRYCNLIRHQFRFGLRNTVKRFLR